MRDVLNQFRDLKEKKLNLIKAITGKLKRRVSNRAKLIALPKAVMIYTDDGSIIVTPQLARDIHANLPEITKQAESKIPKKKQGQSSS